ncbi:hypothetical protein niasHT_018223 [Heterodera trifolii]|uniref:ISXO2-like transposase domain-containing protein n=1 Tax=Heterodera trifolii TaxID=157864 RepID=A0ABD2KUJ1_9BILA
MWTLIYMWTEDFRNKNVIKELGIAKSTCVNWFNYCRTQCVQQQKIGGVNDVVEMDETCWVKQKHNRGKPKKGCSKWFFGAIERGQAFCVAVKDRKKKTLYKLIKKWIRPGSVIISDEWPAYLKLSLHLPQYEHMLIIHKKSTGDGFSKIVMLPDGTEFNVNTNKSYSQQNLSGNVLPAPTDLLLQSSRRRKLISSVRVS